MISDLYWKTKDQTGAGLVATCLGIRSARGYYIKLVLVSAKIVFPSAHAQSHFNSDRLGMFYPSTIYGSTQSLFYVYISWMGLEEKST